MSDSIYNERTPFADEMHRDLAMIRRFGSENPGVLVDLKLSHEPRTHLAVLLKTDTAGDVVTSLRQRLTHGDHLEVEFTTVTADQLEMVSDEISTLIRERGSRALCQSDNQWGQVHIRLRADQHQLAAELLHRYGKMARIEVGLEPYPPQPGLARVEHPQSTQPA